MKMTARGGVKRKKKVRVRTGKESESSVFLSYKSMASSTSVPRDRRMHSKAGGIIGGG